MPRSPTTSDPFNAIGDATRRAMLVTLSTRESTVTELVDRLGCTQPQVSKHLRVLREVGLVRCRTVGRNRIYRAHAAGLAPFQSWLDQLTTAANEHFDRLDNYLDTLQTTSTERGNHS